MGSPQPRESFTRNLHRFPQPSLDEIRSLSISEQENGADNLKKHSNVLVLEVGSPSKYTVDTVRVLPFFRIFGPKLLRSFRKLSTLFPRPNAKGSPRLLATSNLFSIAGRRLILLILLVDYYKVYS